MNAVSSNVLFFISKLMKSINLHSHEESGPANHGSGHAAYDPGTRNSLLTVTC